MQSTGSNKPQGIPGLTGASLAAALFGLVATAILVQYSEIQALIAFPAEHTLAVPVICVLGVLLVIGSAFFALTRVKLLSRAELLCVLYILLIATPLMTQGFWHRLVSILATHPRQGDFHKLDVLHDDLWPHGPNLLKDAFGASRRAGVQTRGTVRWLSLEYEQGRSAELPVLLNAAPGEESAVRVNLPIGGDPASAARPGELYMLSTLARATGLGPETQYGCSFCADGEGPPLRLFSSTTRPRPDVINRTGFTRVGAYGVRVPAAARRAVTVEFWLSGPGRLELAQPKLLNVEALERVYTGRRLARQSEYDRLPPAERAGVVVRPDRLWSLAGARFLLSGYIPMREWVRPLSFWGGFVLLLLGGMFAVNVLMRRQWMDHERFQLPMARIPLALLDDGGDPDRALAPVWRNRLMWAGFAAALAWELLKAWHFYNPKVPDLAINAPLLPYFPDPRWGGMWERMRFEVVAVFIALCSFMELNVLISLVLGHFALRALHPLGQITGWSASPDYPFGQHLVLGAYIGYAAALLFLARRHLGRAVREALRPPAAPAVDPEALSYRAAFLLLIGALAGALALARALRMDVWGTALFFVFLVAVGAVASRIRTECGTPWGYFAPPNTALFLVLLGGIGRFGPELLLFAYILSFMVAPTVFFLIPGAQMELLELGRRWRVRRADLACCVALGAVGGLAVGGWVFLSNAYALGGNSLRYNWAFDTKWWYFFSYNQELNAATVRGLGGSAGAGGVDAAVVAGGAAAVVAAALAVVRQFFAGFWFHPVGFVLGAANFMDYIWGSALAAWAIRSVVLRFGGAATVRTKLQPFFVGVFLGAVAAYGVLTAHSAWLRASGVERIYSILQPA